MRDLVNSADQIWRVFVFLLSFLSFVVFLSPHFERFHLFYITELDRIETVHITIEYTLVLFQGVVRVHLSCCVLNQLRSVSFRIYLKSHLENFSNIFPGQKNWSVEDKDDYLGILESFDYRRICVIIYEQNNVISFSSELLWRFELCGMSFKSCTETLV